MDVVSNGEVHHVLRIFGKFFTILYRIDTCVMISVFVSQENGKITKTFQIINIIEFCDLIVSMFQTLSSSKNMICYWN